MINVVILNGGRGASTIIPELIEKNNVKLTSIVNAYDDGKSTGEIRRFFSMLGPSDIRKVQELLLDKDDKYYLNHLKLFQFRLPKSISRSAALKELNSFSSNNTISLFDIPIEDVIVRKAIKFFIRTFLANLMLVEKVHSKKFTFPDCSIMNCIYAGAFLAMNRNIEDVAIYLQKIFNLKGSVLPNSIENKTLSAIRENGVILYSEAEIVELRSNVLIDRIFMLDQPFSKKSFKGLTAEERKEVLINHHSFLDASPRVRSALTNADIIIYAPGTQHSSLYPTYLSDGLSESIADNKKAIKFFITNIGADYETPTYKASDYILNAFRYLNYTKKREFRLDELFDYVLVNSAKNIKNKSYVSLDKKKFLKIPVKLIIKDFESSSKVGKHDGQKIVNLITEVFNKSLKAGS